MSEEETGNPDFFFRVVDSDGDVGGELRPRLHPPPQRDLTVKVGGKKGCVVRSKVPKGH